MVSKQLFGTMNSGALPVMTRWFSFNTSSFLYLWDVETFLNVSCPKITKKTRSYTLEGDTNIRFIMIANNCRLCCYLKPWMLFPNCKESCDCLITMTQEQVATIYCRLHTVNSHWQLPSTLCGTSFGYRSYTLLSDGGNSFSYSFYYFVVTNLSLFYYFLVNTHLFFC